MTYDDGLLPGQPANDKWLITHLVLSRNGCFAIVTFIISVICMGCLFQPKMLLYSYDLIPQLPISYSMLHFTLTGLCQTSKHLLKHFRKIRWVVEIREKSLRFQRTSSSKLVTSLCWLRNIPTSRQISSWACNRVTDWLQSNNYMQMQVFVLMEPLCCSCCGCLACCSMYE